MRKIVEGRSIRWDEERAQQAYQAGQWVTETLVDHLVSECRHSPNRPLLIEGDTILTPRILDSQSRQLAAYLLANFPQGSVVSFMLPNWIETAVIYMAATMAGMVVHPILPSLRGHDLSYMLNDINSRIIFIPSCYREFNYCDMLENVCTEMKNPPQVIVLRGDAANHMAYSDAFLGDPLLELPKLNADAVRMIMYTSGTTGSPKGVMHSHNSIHALIKQIGEHWRISSTSKFLVASPISHIGGSIYAFETPLLLGACTVLMEQWQPTAGAELLINHRCTHFAGATPFLSQLLAAAREIDNRLDDLEVFICGGASVPPSLIEDAQQYFAKASVTRVYGSTEVPVTSVGALLPGEEHYAAYTDGRPAIAEVKLVANELLARGPQMLVGYVHKEDEDKVFDTQGFYHTGDLATWLDDKYLVISGRSKDIIIRNGENISPKEIEDLLIMHPAVKEVAIVGVPNDKTGERAVAVVVPNIGVNLDVGLIFDFLVAKNVAKFKIPEQVECWHALPKNDAGKVLKHKIRERLLAHHAQ
jgi:acyl-CoA synthetase (AMP-forming)/AMP-acid ligase II